MPNTTTPSPLPHTDLPLPCPPSHPSPCPHPLAPATHLVAQGHDCVYLSVPLRRHLLLLADEFRQVGLLCQPHRGARLQHFGQPADLKLQLRNLLLGFQLLPGAGEEARADRQAGGRAGGWEGG